jgi:spore coat polysaccharide biosynthesis protein SpsF
VRLAILQARMTSTRLPGKVLKDILGKPMLVRQLERVRRSQRIDKLVVATSTDQSDSAITELCAFEGVDCFRGNLSDVLDRYYQCTKQYPPSLIVRLTGDCPLADSEIIDSAIDLHERERNDYTSTTLQPSFPDGLDVEVVTPSALEVAWKEAVEPFEREHVMPFIWRRPERFKLGQFRNAQDYSQLRWTVDRPEDLELVLAVYRTLYPHNQQFGWRDVLALVTAQPDLTKLNSHIVRNESLKRQLAEREK